MYAGISVILETMHRHRIHRRSYCDNTTTR